MNIYRTITIVAILLITALSQFFIDRGGEKKVILPFSTFPLEIGPWKGKAGHFEDWVYKKTGVDDSLLANYHDAAGNHLQLYIGYYGSQREGDTIHSPRNCMPGGGWNISEMSRIDVVIPSRNQKTVKIALLKIQNGSQKQLVLYWYHSRGRIISSEYWHKFYLIYDSITRHRTDGSFVRLISPVDNNEEKTFRLLKHFAIELFPILDKYIPS